MPSALGDLKGLLPQLNETSQYRVIDAYYAWERGRTTDDNRAPPVQRTVWILLAISTIVIFTRLVVKLRTTRRLYLDDALMILALLTGWMHAIFISISLSEGLGRHIFYLEPDHRYKALKYGFISLAWSYLSPLFGRLSFCAFLLCVCDSDPKAKKWPIWTFIVIQIIVNGLAVFLLFCICGTHLEVVFTRNLIGYIKHCMPLDVQTDYAYFAGAINTLTDLFLTIQPGVLIMHTRLQTRNKIGIASLLCLSVLAMIAAIVRTIGANVLSEIGDHTWDLAPYVVWISVELNVVITVTSLPLLRPLARDTREMTARLLSNRKIKDAWDDTISLRSMPLSSHEEYKIGAGVGVTAVGISSARDGFTSQQDPFSITRTVEVEVSHSDNATPLIHAALVGLIQGERMERLAGR